MVPACHSSTSSLRTPPHALLGAAGSASGPREAGLLLLQSSPPRSTLCQESPALPAAPAPSPGAACVLPATGSCLLRGLEMAIPATLAALKALSEGWGEELQPDGSGTTAQQHPWGPWVRTSSSAVHPRFASPCSLPELPWGFPHPLTEKGAGLSVLEAAVCSSRRCCFVGGWCWALPGAELAGEGEGAFALVSFWQHWKSCSNALLRAPRQVKHLLPVSSPHAVPGAHPA